MSDQDKAEIIIEEVCRFYGTTFEKINVKARDRELVEPRQVIMYFMKQHTGFSLKTIAGYFGKDHATVLHALRTIAGLIQMNGLACKTNIMAGRINFNMRQFHIRKDAESFDKWTLSICQF